MRKEKIISQICYCIHVGFQAFSIESKFKGIQFYTINQINCCVSVTTVFILAKYNVLDRLHFAKRCLNFNWNCITLLLQGTNTVSEPQTQKMSEEVVLWCYTEATNI